MKKGWFVEEKVSVSAFSLSFIFCIGVDKIIPLIKNDKTGRYIKYLKEEFIKIDFKKATEILSKLNV